ncbi:type VII secretion target [Streptomyces xanthophaeus]|uniref:type VII secretion target n=1 Tax=Streptomyces xanthophaeus TaxID=67385 RepID=UPI00371BC40C
MADDKLPEPSQLPLTPDELKRHNSEWAGNITKAPAPDSYRDPLTPLPLKPASPLLQQPPSLGNQPFAPAPDGPTQDRLKIEPGVLNTAAGKADEIHTAFTKPAAALEEHALAVAAAMTGWDSGDAVKAAHKQWEKQAGAVAGWLAHIAESLRIGARDYHKTNAEIEQSFQGLKRRSMLDGL